MARGRTKGDHEIKRIEIAEAAYKVFLRLGLERTSLADIAREIGNTTGVLRHYFADKDELLLFAKNLVFDRTYERAKGAADRREGLDSIRAMIRELLPANSESIDGYRLLAMFNGSAIGDSRLMKLQDRRNVRHALLLADLIETLQKKGPLKKDLDPRIEAASILALIDGLAEQVIMRPSAWTRDQLTALLDKQIDNLVRSAR